MSTQKSQSATKTQKQEIVTASKGAAVNRQDQADKVIVDHMAWSALAGCVPVPIYDFAAVTSCQLLMLKKISEVYGVSFKDELGKKVISSMISTLGAGFIGKSLAASLLKSIPVIGTATGFVLMPALASASTYALGKVFINHYENGGNLTDFDSKKMETFFKEKLQEGKKKASDLKASLK